MSDLTPNGLCGAEWGAAGWNGVVALMALGLGLALVIALRLRGLVPINVAPACI